MNKKRWVSVSNFIVVLALMGIAVFYFFSPEDKNPNAIFNSQMPESPITNGVENGLRYAPEKDLIGGICALLLLGYLFWACYRKSERDSRTEQAVKENTLYDISLETGRNEYDLFAQSAENWSISRHRIEQDFKRYMADQVMPHYAKDFVRKNQAHIDKSLVKKRNVTPVTRSDWAIALLVFPGSFLFILLFALLMD